MKLFIFFLFSYIDFAPPSRKSLHFHDEKKAGDNRVTVNSVCTNKNISGQNQSKKRDYDEMFLPLLSDEEDDGREMDEQSFDLGKQIIT